MPLMSLRESLSRSKDKWKKRLHLGSRRVDPIPPLVNDKQATPIREVDNPPTKDSIAWSGVKTILQVLESSSDAFGPLKSAVSGLNRCIDIYERAAKGRKDYNELRGRLNDLLIDLTEHLTQPMDGMMTKSVMLLCREIEAETIKVEGKQGRNIGQRLFEAMDTPEEIFESYRRINDYLARLTLNANLSTLRVIHELAAEARLKGISPATAAIYDSTESDDIKRGSCTPGTRQPQIDLLLEWARDPEAGRTCWMNGMAGTGKTTIAYSVCTALEQSSALGASFFCSRIIPECRQVKHIIPTIAYQLARYSLPFRCALDKVLELNPDARTRTLKIQFQKLIIEPLVEVQSSLPTDFIIVIDALDECEHEESLGQILDILFSPATVLPIRFLVSSRPEPVISRRMAHIMGEEDRTRLVLHDLNTDAVKLDIEIYMRHELEQIPLTGSQWSSLLERCGVLFIYASTACRLVKQGHELHTLGEAINVIVGPASASTLDEENAIDELYRVILTVAFDKGKINLANRQRMKALVETIICAVEPMNLDILTTVLGLESAEHTNALLQPLRSVFNITSTGLVTTLHASFADFMFSPSRSASFHCVATNRHTSLARACLRVIGGIEPKMNICELPTSYLADNQVKDLEERVKRAISPGLIYASRHWSAHLYHGGDDEELVKAVQTFLSEKLLLWMEIINLTKLMRFGTSIIRNAEKWCRNKGKTKDLTILAGDATQFVSVYANHPISESTPHIYVSMLAFWPRARPVSIAYMPRTIAILEPTGVAIDRRQPALLATWKVSIAEVNSIDLSTDGSQIFAAAEGSIDVLDASTGDRVLHIEGPEIYSITNIATSSDPTKIALSFNMGAYLLDLKSEAFEVIMRTSLDLFVTSISFSLGGSQIAVGQSDGTIYIYTLQQRNPMLDGFRGHTDAVNSISFSSDGRFLASGSNDKIIHIWELKSGQIVGDPLVGHTREVWSVSYSPDDTRLASTSSDGTIRVWDPLRGQTVLGPLNTPSTAVCVTFCPDGAFIAVGLNDNTILVYDAQTGQIVLGPLEGHTRSVNSVVFSPDGAQLFSCSGDGTIRLWNIQVQDISNGLQPNFPEIFCCIRYNPDGSRVISGSSEGVVCVWDVKTGEMVLDPLQGHSDAVWGVDYSPNEAYIASASGDSTLRIWGAQDGRDLHGPIKGHTKDINCVRFSPNSSLLVSGSDDNTVRIWDVLSGRSTIEPLKGSASRILSVAFSPDGNRVISGSSDGKIQGWDIRTSHAIITSLQSLSVPFSLIEFSQDNSRILSGSLDRSIQIWDAQTGQEILHCNNDQTDITSVAFSPDGLLVASASDNKTIRIWDTQTGDLVSCFEGHSQYVWSVQFSPDGSHVVSCSNDGTIRLWDVANRIAKLRLKKSKGLDKVDARIDWTQSPWSLDRSGWLAGRWGQRLVWVPEDLRISTPRHPNDLVFCKQGSLRFDFDSVKLGEKWMHCYQP